MSTRPVVRLVLVGLLLIAAACLRVGIAGAADVSALAADSLAPSKFPDLLGPINENGRVGWACRPEKAAESKSTHMAELPAADSR
jgi:hypothetical protein